MARQRQTRRQKQDVTKKENGSDTDDVKVKKEDVSNKTDGVKARYKQIDRLYRIIQAGLNWEEKENFEEAKKFWKDVVRHVEILEMANEGGDMLKKQTEHHDDLSRTPLLLAVEGNVPYEVVQALVRANKDSCEQFSQITNSYPLHMACACKRELSNGHERKNEQVIRLLMDTFPEAIMKQDEDGATALHLLLEHEPPLDLVHDMVQKANTQMVGSVQIERNAILNIKDQEAQLPIHVAIEWKASDEIVKLLAELFPGGLNEIVGDDKLSCLHLALYHQRYNVVEKIAELFPEKIQKKSKSGDSPLHMLLSQKQHSTLSKEDLQRLCSKLLFIYKKYVEKDPKARVNWKINYLLKRVKNINNESIIQVAEKALKNVNHSGVTSGLVQMLNDASQGNFSLLNNITPESNVKTEDVPIERKRGKEKDSSSQTSSRKKIIPIHIVKTEHVSEEEKRVNEQDASPTPRKSNQTISTLRITNGSSIDRDSPRKVSQETQENLTLTNTEAENNAHPKSPVVNDKESQNKITNITPTNPLESRVNLAESKNGGQITFETPKRVENAEAVYSPFFDSKEPNFDDISLGSDNILLPGISTNGNLVVVLQDQPETRVEIEIPSEPNKTTDTLLTTVLNKRNQTHTSDNNAIDTNETKLHDQRDEINFNTNNVGSPQKESCDRVRENTNIPRNEGTEKKDSNHLNKNSASFDHSENNSIEVSKSRERDKNEAACVQNVTDGNESKKTVNSFSMSRINSDISIPTSFVAESNTAGNIFQEKKSSSNALNIEHPNMCGPNVNPDFDTGKNTHNDKDKPTIMKEKSSFAAVGKITYLGTDVSTISGNSQETDEGSNKEEHMDKIVTQQPSEYNNDFELPMTCGKRKRRPLENSTNELIFL